MNAQTGIVPIRGKEYHTVAKRVADFREKHPDYALTTQVLFRDDDCVVMQATIADASGRTIATGHAEEYRKSSQINKTSALENAETSAIGRALAAFGIGGTEFASANEVENAVHQQAQGGRQEHSQGDSQGAVSPAAKQPAHSKLKTELRGFVHELEGIGDWDTYAAFRDTKDFKRLTKDCEEKLPHWWEGWETQPDGFIPLRRRIEILEANLAEKQANLVNAG